MKKLFTVIAAALLSIGLLNAETTIVMDGQGADWNDVPMLTEPGVSPVVKAVVNSQDGVTLPAGAAFSIMVKGVDASLGYPVIYTDADKSAETKSEDIWFCPALGSDFQAATWSAGSSFAQDDVTEMTIATEAFGSIPFTGSCYAWFTYNWGALYVPTDAGTEGWKWSLNLYTPWEFRPYSITDISGTHTAAQVYGHHPVLALGATLNFGGTKAEDVAFWASWPVEVTTPGIYTVSANISCDNTASCDLYLVDMGTNTVVASFASADKWQPSGETEFGEWDLNAVPAGKYMLKMKNHVEWSHMVLSSVTLTCTSSNPITLIDMEHVVNLSTAANANGDNCSWTLSNGELLVNYDFSSAAAGSWPNGGVEFALPDLTRVTGISYEFLGNDADWTSFQVYLKDENGIRWYNAGADLHLSGINEWTYEEYMPSNQLWGSGAVQGTTFKAIGFLANHGDPTQNSFQIRNVKVLYKGEGPAPEPEGPSYDLTVSAAGMSTLMLPFSVSTLPTGVKAYDLTVEDSDIKATEVFAITPEEPVLIVAPQGTYTFEGEGSDDISGKTVVYHNGALHGTYVGCQVPTYEAGEYCYVLQNHSGEVAFYQVTGTSNKTISPYRAYLRATYNALGAASAAPRMRIVFQANTTTSIDENKTPTLDEALRNGAVFDIMGRRVGQINKNGLYIVDGRAYIIK